MAKTKQSRYVIFAGTQKQVASDACYITLNNQRCNPPGPISDQHLCSLVISHSILNQFHRVSSHLRQFCNSLCVMLCPFLGGSVGHFLRQDQCASCFKHGACCIRSYAEVQPNHTVLQSEDQHHASFRRSDC